jgi:hypothetical protein
LLKKFGFVATGVVAGMALFGGMASAGQPDEDAGYQVTHDESGQGGLVNLSNLDAVHSLNAAVGLCDNEVNVLGVQVPVRDIANGIGVPVLSPGVHKAEGQSPYNCASGGADDAGTSQDN